MYKYNFILLKTNKQFLFRKISVLLLVPIKDRDLKSFVTILPYYDLTIEVENWVKSYMYPRTNDGISFECNIPPSKVFIKMTANNSS